MPLTPAQTVEINEIKLAIDTQGQLILGPRSNLQALILMPEITHQPSLKAAIDKQKQNCLDACAALIIALEAI